MSQASRTRVMHQRWNKGSNGIARYRQRVAQHIAPGMAVLHAGCGWDRLNVTRPYREVAQVVGVDCDPRVASMFHSTFHLGDLGKLPFPSGSFDLVLCEYVAEHLEHPGAVLREMRRVLKPGGCILMLTPNLYSYKTLGSALTPYAFHLWAGRIRYGAGHEPDMYPTVYRLNTEAAFKREASAAGLQVVGVEYVTNGPTWFERVPGGVFPLADLAHRAMGWEVLRWLRCNLVVELAVAQSVR